MSFLEQIHSALNGPDNMTEVLRLTVEHFRADSGTIHMLEADGVMHLAAAQGVPEPVLDKVRLVPIGKGMAGQAALRKEPVNVCNLQTDTSGDVRPGARATGMEGAMVVPVLRDGDALGALGIANRTERTFTPEEVALLMDVGRAIGASCRLARSSAE